MKIRNIYRNRIGIIAAYACIFSFISSCQNSEVKFEKQRNLMVEEQIKDRGIIDRNVINAMRTVKRHVFVPEELQEKSYGDFPLSIGFDQTIYQPYIVAFMTELLELDNQSRVLEIGTGSGYQAAVLASICKEVYTIEIVKQLSVNAQNILTKEGFNNIYFKVGDGYLGWPEKSPFDAIIVTCAPENIPPDLKDQLAEGGRMIIPVGRSYVQKLVLIRKINGKMSEQMVLPVRFAPMVDKEGNVY